MKARLGNYISEYSVRNHAGENIPVYSVTNTEGFCTGYFDKDVSSKDKTTYKIVPKGFFAYNPSRINVGSIDWQRYRDRVIVSPLYVVFSVSDRLLPQYLYYYLKSNVGLNYICATSQGSVRNNLKFSMLQDFPLEIRTIEDQKVVISILDKIKNLRLLQKKNLEQYDNLIKARFVEMFENVTYRKVPLIETIREGAGLSYGIVVPGNNVKNGIPMIRPSDFKNSTLDLSNVYKVEPEIECKYAKTRLLGDEILVQVIGQPGQVMLATDQCRGMNVTRNLAVIRPNHKIINRYYLKQYIEKEDSQQQLLKNTKQSTLKQLPLSLLKKLEIQVPPIDLQNQFADFVQQVDKSKSVVQKTLNQTQLLFDSLMQQYFG